MINISKYNVKSPVSKYTKEDFIIFFPCPNCKHECMCLDSDDKNCKLCRASLPNVIELINSERERIKYYMEVL